MKTIPARRKPRKRKPATDDGPLFRWAIMCPAEHFPNLPRPARIIARRFGIPPERARVVAELAGFKSEI